MRNRSLGHRASGPPGRRGPRAAGPSRAAGFGPLGLRAAGPLGRRGPWAAGRWAAGLLFAKPENKVPQIANLTKLKQMILVSQLLTTKLVTNFTYNTGNIAQTL